MKEVIETNKAYKSDNPFSQAIRADNFLFLSGQGPIDPVTKKIKGDNIKDQTEYTFKNIVNILKAAGLGIDDIVKVTVYISDSKDFKDFNYIYNQIIKPPYPARTTIVSKLVGDFRIEIDVIAYDMRGRAK